MLSIGFVPIESICLCYFFRKTRNGSSSAFRADGDDTTLAVGFLIAGADNTAEGLDDVVHEHLGCRA